MQVKIEEMLKAKKLLEEAVGLTFSEVQDNASSCENNGHGVSYCLEQGHGHASTRCQVWITARKRDGIRYDMYVGTAWIQTGTINIEGLAKWRRSNDNGQGNKYTCVPFAEVVKWFDDNRLGRFAKAREAKEQAKANATKAKTKTKARSTTAKVKKA